ncbi:MAG: class I SAM-dependent methyltransferase [Bacillota bacterium]|nr:class I SAM-dependent methyltransferase [Bacillota bacterium]
MVEWVQESERQWDKRAEDWYLKSKEMWEIGSRREIIPLFERYLGKGDRICDLGCGDGYASFMLAKKGFQVTGIDVSEQMLEKARQRAEGLPVNYVRKDISSLLFANEAFDAVMAINSLEWIENPLQGLLEIKRVTKSGGHICIAILGPTSMPRTNSFRRLLGEKVICNTMMPWELEKLAKDNGLTKIDEMGVYKRGVEKSQIESLSMELKQALSFLWVFILKK